MVTLQVRNTFPHGSGEHARAFFRAKQESFQYNADPYMDVHVSVHIGLTVLPVGEVGNI